MMKHIKLTVAIFLTCLVSIPLFRTFFPGNVWNHVNFMELLLRFIIYLLIVALSAGLAHYLINLISRSKN